MTRIGTHDNAFLTKYSSSGDRQWTKLLGVDDGDTMAVGVAVSDADGSVYITGKNTGGNLDNVTRIGTHDNGFLTKYSSSGDKQWTKLLGVDDRGTWACG